MKFPRLSILTTLGPCNISVYSTWPHSGCQKTAPQTQKGKKNIHGRSLLSELQCVVADGLRARFNRHRLVVGESVILSFYACLVNKRPSISSQPRHCTADVSIQLHNLLDTARVKKRRCNPLLYCKHDTFSSLYSDGGRSKLDNDNDRTFENISV